MAFPLVVGAISSNPMLQKDSLLVIAATLVPALYVVGMAGDFVGQTLTHPFKESIGKKVCDENSELEVSSQKVHAFAVALEPRLAKQMDARSTRDRIVRGSLAAVLPLLFYWPYTHDASRGLALVAGIGLSIALGLLWSRMQKLSAGYEMQVLKVLRAKYPAIMEENFPTKGCNDGS